MNHLSIFTLKVLRRLYTKTFGNFQLPLLQCEENPNKISDTIYKLLADEKPCMIARFGATELSCINNYLSIKNKHNIWKYIIGEGSDFWWNSKIMEQMQQWSGFFPPTTEKLELFCQLMLKETKQIDICGIFPSIETGITTILPYMNNPTFVALYAFNPFVTENPWSRILEGKKVLVIHPFAELIERQYQKRELLFKNPNVLPLFNLKVIKAVQSLGGESNGFSDWFEALQWMQNQMDQTDYEICLIGCGAYGFSLAAHAKKMGKKAIHIGGGLQLLFGIKGARWETATAATQWGLPADFYQNLFANPAWVRPDEYRTKQSEKVENACYW